MSEEKIKETIDESVVEEDVIEENYGQISTAEGELGSCLY